jgi:hypothetical protein
VAKKSARSHKIPEWDGTCSSCGKSVADTSFGAGRAGECNYCAKVRWKANNPVKVRAQSLYSNVKKRSKDMGWPAPDFGSLWIEEKIISGHCEVTGIPFDLTSQMWNSNHARNPWMPSVDRIYSAGVYARDNVQLVVYMYNVCKAEFLHSDVVRFCRVVAAMEAEVGQT